MVRRRLLCLQNFSYVAFLILEISFETELPDLAAILVDGPEVFKLKFRYRSIAGLV